MEVTPEKIRQQAALLIATLLDRLPDTRITVSLRSESPLGPAYLVWISGRYDLAYHQAFDAVDLCEGGQSYIDAVVSEISFRWGQATLKKIREHRDAKVARHVRG